MIQLKSSTPAYRIKIALETDYKIDEATNNPIDK